ncbi:hypothetical protein SUGI_0375290 [Cryptomeria japonica]|nr:hypothetical protein SUGI_0375290 [Cryptomeria japonica]
MSQQYDRPQDAAQQLPAEGMRNKEKQKATQSARAAQETAQRFKGTAVNKTLGTDPSAIEKIRSAQEKAIQTTVDRNYEQKK